jgi:serine/threonine protein kinase
MNDDLFVSGGKLHIDGREVDLNGYVFEKEISRGASGILYLANDPILERALAVKLWTKLRPDDARDKIRQGMSEAQKAWKAQSDEVVRIFFSGFLGGVFYTVMEVVPGQTLKSWLRVGTRRILGEQFYIAETLIDFDANLISRGIVHGDLHWENIMICEDESPDEGWGTRYRNPIIKILDFGTSRFSGKEVSIKRHYGVLVKTVRECILPVPLDEIMPAAKPKEAGTDKTREWLRKSIYAVRASLHEMGHHTGWPYYIDAMAGLTVPRHSNLDAAKKLLTAMLADGRINARYLGGSEVWSKMDGIRDRHPLD